MTVALRAALENAGSKQKYKPKAESSAIVSATAFGTAEQSIHLRKAKYQGACHLAGVGGCGRKQSASFANIRPQCRVEKEGEKTRTQGFIVALPGTRIADLAEIIDNIRLAKFQLQSVA